MYIHVFEIAFTVEHPLCGDTYDETYVLAIEDTVPEPTILDALEAFKVDNIIYETITGVRFVYAMKLHGPQAEAALWCRKGMKCVREEANETGEVLD